MQHPPRVVLRFLWACLAAAACVPAQVGSDDDGEPQPIEDDDVVEGR